MLSRKQIIFPTTPFLLVGLLAFNLCQVHAVSNHEHESASDQEPVCSFEAEIPPVLPSQLLGVPDPVGPNPNSLLTSWPALDDSGSAFNYVSKIVDPFVFPVSTTKRYQYTCAYLL